MHLAVEFVETIPNTHKDVWEMLSTTHAKQKEENSMSTIGYLSRQGMALRGKYRIDDIAEERGELDSNFIQLLKVKFCFN